MSSPHMRHPEEEELLRFVDGELPARASSQVRSHLEACWQCRAQLEELQSTIGQCVSYRKNVLHRHLQPPTPWPDIYTKFAEIDASIEHPSLLTRAARFLSWPLQNTRKWAPVAVALLIVWGLWWSRFRITPSVQAAELLQKAIVAADTHPAMAHRLDIRTKTRHITRTTAKVTNAVEDSALQSIQALFVAANYNWDDPLSAKSFEAWRDHLAERTDQVTDQHDSYQIRTDAGSGELKDATLTLRSQDLAPLAGRFEFSNQEWVEITAIADETIAPTQPIAATHEPAPESHASAPAVATSPAPSFSLTPGDELHVLASLHNAGADLGDPIEISRTSSEILVTGIGISPTRQRDIQSAIGAQPHVTVHFLESAPSSATSEKNAKPSTDNTASPDLRQFQSRVADQIGGRANFEQLASDVLDLSEPMMSRVYALRRLAERFPAATESQLSAPDRQLLHQIQAEHIAGLRQQTSELSRLLKPVLSSVRGSAATSELASSSWQPATEELFQAARRLDKLLAVMFGAAPGESVGDRLPADLLASLTQFRAMVEGYTRVSSKLER